MEVFCNLKLGCMGSAFHCTIMDHLVAEDPKAVGNGQEVGNHSGSPGGGHTAGGDTGQIGLLESRPFHG